MLAFYFSPSYLADELGHSSTRDSIASVVPGAKTAVLLSYVELVSTSMGLGYSPVALQKASSLFRQNTKIRQVPVDNKQRFSFPTAVVPVLHPPRPSC